MSANIHGEMVYSFEQPMWHAITKPSEVQMGAEEIVIKRFGGAFPVFLRSVYVELNGKRQDTGDLAIVRGVSPADPKEVIFGYCTERYHPLQPIEVARCFDEHVRQPAETMAFLGQGEEMFISWVLPEFEVVKEDPIKMYGIVRGGFDTLKAYRLFTANVRPVCWNTITMAEGWAKAHTDRSANKGMIWKGKGVNKNLSRDLGYWLEHVQGKALHEAELLKNFFGKLAQTPIKNDDEAWKILFKAYPVSEFDSESYPVQLREDKAEKVEVYNQSQQGIRDGIHSLFTGAGTAITPDYYGMLNATSEYFCHYQPSKRPIAESVMFGPRSRNIMAMVNTLAGK
jgi:hypothetical protein